MSHIFKKHRDLHLVGTGYWYHVYDIGNGRVLKKEKSVWDKVTDTYQLEGKQLMPYLRALGRLISGRTIIKQTYAFMKGVDPHIIGFPTFRDGIDYEQNLVQVVASVFDTAPQNIKKEIIDAYIENILLTWEYGFADRVFNFTVNSGLLKDGAVILLDFNEVTFDKTHVVRQIETRRWLQALSYRLLDDHMKDYYTKKMEGALTTSTLNRVWEKRKM